MDLVVREALETFLASLPADSPYPSRPFDADKWGDSPEMADELGALIANGSKTATCSSVWEWEAEGQAWPQAGHLTLVLNGAGQPLCMIEVVEVTVKPFNQVDAQFAYEEGEGDRSLDYWRSIHQHFFERGLSRIDKQFSEDIPLVCERFKVIYRF
jgi:uncharacterized protein YhfF